MDNIKKIYVEMIGLPMPSGSLEDQLKYRPLIEEDKHKEVNIGQAALGYLKKNLSRRIAKIDYEKLKSLILPSWKYYNDFCINSLNIDLYLLETDFKNPRLAVTQLQKIDSSINMNEVLNSMKPAMNGTYGLSFKLDEKTYVILIDSNIFKDDRKIQHEFSHYVQEITGNLILDGDIEKNIKKYFRLDDQYAVYIFHKQEFWINIFNDLFNGLQKIYWLRFKNAYSWEEFIDFQFNDLKLNAAIYSKSQLYTLWFADVKINIFYIKILAVIAYAKADFFNEIVERLKNK